MSTGTTIDRVVSTNTTTNQVVLTLNPSYSDQNISDWITTSSDGQQCITTCLKSSLPLNQSQNNYGPKWSAIKMTLPLLSSSNNYFVLIIIALFIFSLGLLIGKRRASKQ